MKYLISCTEAKPYLVKSCIAKKYALRSVKTELFEYPINGKIVAEFEGECEEIGLIDQYNIFASYGFLNRAFKKFNELCEDSCLKENELNDYLNGNNGYAIHIKNLKAFDKPLELSETYKEYIETEKNVIYQVLTKAPQNMCYCWYKGEKCVLISIQPQWVCKILNGEKTIEVRKKVLKEMIK